MRLEGRRSLLTPISMRRHMNQVSKRVQSIFELQTQHKWVNKTSSVEERLEKLQKLKTVIEAREDDAVKALHDDLRRDEEGARGEVASIYGEIAHVTADLALSLIHI